MNVTSKLRPAAISLVAALMLASCAANELAPQPDGEGLQGTINGMGSSAQSAAQTTWAAGFQADHQGVTVNYDPQGSGAGRSAFLSGAVAFAGSDAPLSATEAEGPVPTCEAGTDPANLPVYISPIAIAYNLPEVPELRLDARTLALIFAGEVTQWDDPLLQDLNPGAEMPDLAITVVRRADDSGTTQNFTEYLAAVAPDDWGAPASQTYPYPVGDAAKGTSGVADASRGAHGSIAYLDLSGVSGLQTAMLKVGDEFSPITAEGAAAVVAESPLLEEDQTGVGGYAIEIDHSIDTPGAWPIVSVSYLVVCEQYADAELGDLVSAYAEYVAGENAQVDAHEAAGSAPLAPELAEKVITTARAIGEEQ